MIRRKGGREGGGKGEVNGGGGGCMGVRKEIGEEGKRGYRGVTSRAREKGRGGGREERGREGAEGGRQREVGQAQNAQEKEEELPARIMAHGRPPKAPRNHGKEEHGAGNEKKLKNSLTAGIEKTRSGVCGGVSSRQKDLEEDEAGCPNRCGPAEPRDKVARNERLDLKQQKGRQKDRGTVELHLRGERAVEGPSGHACNTIKKGRQHTARSVPMKRGIGRLLTNGILSSRKYSGWSGSGSRRRHCRKTPCSSSSCTPESLQRPCRACLGWAPHSSC